MSVRVFAAVAASIFLFAGSPASAQSAGQPRESIQFLKGVRERNPTEVNKVLQDKSSRLINAKDAYGDGDGALHIIARMHNKDYLPVFLGQEDINVNLQNRLGDTPLMVAVDSGWIEGVQLLLGARANVNLANQAGETPLIRAVLLRNFDEMARVEIVRALLDAGANPDKADYHGGMSAREYAARETRYPAIAKLLADAPKGGKSSASAAGPRL
jgi:uncharacterized protein